MAEMRKRLENTFNNKKVKIADLIKTWVCPNRKTCFIGNSHLQVAPGFQPL